MTNQNLLHLNAFRQDSDTLNVIIETPKGSRNKFDYDDETGLFALGESCRSARSSRSTLALCRQLSVRTATPWTF